jgi:peptidoglycan/LPS O-acetylase OafA/YrhL
MSQMPFAFRFLFIISRFLLSTFTPSFIYNLSGPTKVRKLHKTSFLDGLRGVASLIVAVSHLIPPRETWLLVPYGVENHDGVNNQEGMGSNPLQLPIIRLLVSGRPMVQMFFVISGYVLSIKLIRLIRSDQHEKVSDLLVSFIFRRGIRLALPAVVGLILKDILYFTWDSKYPTSLWVWIHDISTIAGKLVYCWDWDAVQPTLFQLWTIPIEHTCSMFLFFVILAVSRVHTWLRFSIVGAIMLHSLSSCHWGPFLFLAGMVIAEIEEIIEERKKEEYFCEIKDEGFGRPIKDQGGGRWISHCQTCFWICVLLATLLLAGYPEKRGETSFIYKHLHPYTPHTYVYMGEQYIAYFWFSISAPFLLFALFRLPALQAPFTIPITQYLGDISYSLYIVHWAPTFIFGNHVFLKAHSLVGVADAQWKRSLCVLLEILIFMPLMIWYADVFWRLVDKQVIKLSRRLDQICRKPDRGYLLGIN